MAVRGNKAALPMRSRVNEPHTKQPLKYVSSRSILTAMTDEGLPFQLLATQAVDAVVATTDNLLLGVLAQEGDLRSSVVAAVELLLIDLDKPICPMGRVAIATMVLRHLSTSGLLSPRDVVRFATRNSSNLAAILKRQPDLIAADTDLAKLLGR